MVARTGPRKAAAILDEFTMPMAVPDARWAIAATDNGKTGAMQSTFTVSTLGGAGTPEPGTMALLGGGLAVVAAVVAKGRMRRKAG